MEHIAKVLEVAETFEKDLKGGTGYEGMLSFLFSVFSVRVFRRQWVEQVQRMKTEMEIGIW